MAPGLVGPEKAARGKRPSDCWWHTIVPTNSREKTGYPTQKPVGIVRRMVAASSRPGGWCLDPFAGLGHARRRLPGSSAGASCSSTRTPRRSRSAPRGSPSSACPRLTSKLARRQRHVSGDRSRGSRGAMDDLSQTPTEAHDYAALNVVWAALLTALLRATARDGRHGPAAVGAAGLRPGDVRPHEGAHEGEGRRVGARAARRGRRRRRPPAARPRPALRARRARDVPALPGHLGLARPRRPARRAPARGPHRRGPARHRRRSTTSCSPPSRCCARRPTPRSPARRSAESQARRIQAVEAPRHAGRR